MADLQTRPKLSRTTLATGAVGAMVVLLLIPLPAVAASGHCLRSELDADVRFPDGEVRHAETLTICLDSMYSPVAGLHRVSVDGHTVGVFVSRTTTAESPDDVAFLRFTRKVHGSGPLTLEGYTLARGEAYRFGPPVRVEATTIWTRAAPTVHQDFITAP